MRKLCEHYDADPVAHREWSFNSRIYGAKAGKDALRKAQHDKCDFCESSFAHVAFGDVEHFRPKAAYRQHVNGRLIRPGYYWLAYEWTNLLYSCQLCNQRFKGNHFPLANAARRAKSHKDDITKEEPLLIHPAMEDPSEFLKFNKEVLSAIGENLRGKATIEIFGLNRDDLLEKRRKILKTLNLLIKSRECVARQITEQTKPDMVALLAELDEDLSHWTSDSAEYAAMVRAALPKPH